jgi:hypothetical protein
MSRVSGLVIALFSFATLLVAGCGGPAAPPVKPDTEHAHSEHGPHEGHLIELGNEEYHAELTHDDATKTVAIYLLGPDAKTAVTIPDTETLTLNLKVGEEPLQAKLTAEKQASDPEGQASKFVVVDEKVLEALEAPKTTGRLSVKIGEKSYSGPVEHEEHGHDHK